MEVKLTALKEKYTAKPTDWRRLDLETDRIIGRFHFQYHVYILLNRFALEKIITLLSFIIWKKWGQNFKNPKQLKNTPTVN